MLPTITPSLLPTSWDLRWWVFKSQQSILGQPEALAGEFYTVCLQVTKPEYWVTLLNVVLVPDMMQMLQLSHLVFSMMSLCQSTLLVGETEVSRVT